MMKNRHLSKAVASQKFYEFRTKLKAKCDENGIELRVVDRWYPSSKICHCCGAIKKDLKLSDRIDVYKRQVIYQQLKTDGKSKAVQYPSKQADTMCQLL